MTHTTSGLSPHCMHCGQIHTNVGQCPRVKAVDYYENGMVKRVEYHPPGDGIALTNIPHPPGALRKIANAIKDGRLDPLKSKQSKNH